MYPSFAQNKIGLYAGPQATRSHYTISGRQQDNEFRYGFHTGVLMKVPFEGNLYFSPTVFYSMKGYKVKFRNYAFPPDLQAVDNNLIMHTLEMAALLQYDFGKKPGRFFIKAGPSIDFQLFGKEEYNLSTGGTVKRNLKFSFSDYGHFAASMLGQFGYETVDGFFVFANYTHGLGSINNADEGPRIKHRVFSISIGKFLNRNKIIIDTRNQE